MTFCSSFFKEKNLPPPSETTFPRQIVFLLSSFELMMEQSQENLESERLRKLFLGGLSFSTTEDDIRKTFQDYGTIVDCVVIRGQPSQRGEQGPSRGFGFVTFAKSTEVDDVLEARKNTKIKMNGREIDIKRAMSREDTAKDPQVNVQTKKIFIGGIGNLKSDHLKDYFSQYGEVEQVIIPTQTGDSSRIRGFAFVAFTNFDIVDKLVAIKNHTINGMDLEVKKATPPTKRGEQEGGGRGDRGGDFRGGNRGGGGGYGNFDRFEGGGRMGRGGYEGGGGGGYDGYRPSYDDGYGRGGPYSRDFGPGGGSGYRDDGFGGGYNSGFQDDYGNQGSNFGPMRGGGRNYGGGGGGGGGPYGGSYGSGGGGYSRSGGGGRRF